MQFLTNTFKPILNQSIHSKVYPNLLLPLKMRLVVSANPLVLKQSQLILDENANQHDSWISAISVARRTLIITDPSARSTQVLILVNIAGRSILTIMAQTVLRNKHLLHVLQQKFPLHNWIGPLGDTLVARIVAKSKMGLFHGLQSFAASIVLVPLQLMTLATTCSRDSSLLWLYSLGIPTASCPSLNQLVLKAKKHNSLLRAIFSLILTHAISWASSTTPRIRNG